MDERDIRELLEDVRRGKLAVDGAVARLRHMPYENLGFARIDHHRSLRQGYPEVVFGRGKTPRQVTEITRGMLRAKAAHNILITRASKQRSRAVKASARAQRAEFHELSGAITIERRSHHSKTRD